MPTFLNGSLIVSLSVENFAYRMCGGSDITSPSGWLSASNSEYDECHWRLVAPKGSIVETKVEEIHMNKYMGSLSMRECRSSYLAVFISCLVCFNRRWRRPLVTDQGGGSLDTVASNLSMNCVYFL